MSCYVVLYSCPPLVSGLLGSLAGPLAADVIGLPRFLGVLGVASVGCLDLGLVCLFLTGAWVTCSAGNGSFIRTSAHKHIHMQGTQVSVITEMVFA